MANLTRIKRNGRHRQVNIKQTGVGNKRVTMNVNRRTRIRVRRV